MIQPVSEKHAPPQVREEYTKIREALTTPTLPLFFTYLGAFPEYLIYISDQIVLNLVDLQFQKLISELHDELNSVIQETLTISPEQKEWINRYRYASSYQNFQGELRQICLTNLKIAVIFLALREAVKGWAVAAKKLAPAYNESEEKIENEITTLNESSFIFSDMLRGIQPTKRDQETNVEIISTSALATTTGSQLEKEIMGEFLALCQGDFAELMKREAFWKVRINIEKTLLYTLTALPKSINSPINVVITLSSKYPQFNDLIYLLSEHFPTYAVHRLMFSEYMRREK
ncbi:hypothetical protein HGB07_04345 [Candidatus Roizmanbacteria bacterium]|nr:hypothetical protein [Candidatus Roizmanbacteria bacterium]